MAEGASIGATGAQDTALPPTIAQRSSNPAVSAPQHSIAGSSDHPAGVAASPVAPKAEVPLPAATAVSIPPDAKFSLQNGQSIVIHLKSDSKSLRDPSLYAPAIPGIIVALVGLYIAHWFSARRDRRKELNDFCTTTKKLADEAATAAITAWTAGAGQSRDSAIHETKRKLQLLGVSATTLALRTKGRKSVDVIREVVALRRAATKDPFEEPDRQPSDAQTAPIMGALAALYAKADRSLINYLGR